jgi:hypothetical protein|tara:strand:+ start:123 stop:569 length:447 start_codon:yes stop_codon:yes gene_type:complete
VKKKDILEKLYLLDELINKTEPDNPPDSHLFSMHQIENQKHMRDVDEERTTKRDVVDIMMKSNSIWSIRNKIWNGEWDSLTPLIQLEQELKDFLSQGQKIAAIKHYRRTMTEQFNVEITLKNAKETCDALQTNMNGIDLMKGVEKKLK